MRKVASLLLCFIFILSLSTGDIFSQNLQKAKHDIFRMKSPPISIEKSAQPSKLPARLAKLYQLHQQQGDIAEYASQTNIKLDGESVVVTILPKQGSTNTINQAILSKFGAAIQAQATRSMRVAIPVAQLENLSEKLAHIVTIKNLVRPVPDAVTSEGVALMNADTWQAESFQGSGVKVAVIDGGFQKLDDAVANGDIPSDYIGVDYSGSGLQSESEHGTAVAEAVYDVAPGVQLYLYHISDLTDLENAKDDAIAQGVHIINHSMSWFLQSYYDGTGPVNDIANDANANGIVWTNSASNSAKDHYRSVFTPITGDYHDFTGSGSKLNPMGPEPGYVWLFPKFFVVQAWLNWDKYPATDQDYDFYLYKWNSSSEEWDQVSSSTTRQTGSEEPTESIAYFNTEDEARFAFAVHKYSATENVDFTIFAGYGLSYHTVANSVTDPASAEGVVTVGAISMNFYENGPQESFSGQGPTNDGRPKPNVTAPDSCNSFAYGHWQGTSLSSPHTAGICALIKSRFSGYTNSQIKNYLYNECTVDLGAAGRDDVYGWGKVVVPDFGRMTDLRASVQGENILLEWSQVDHIAQFNVYRGTNYNFEPDTANGTNRIAQNITDEDTGTDGIQWTDTGNGGDVVGDVNNNYFYRTTAVSSREFAPSNLAGEFDYNLVTTEGTNINLLAVLMHTQNTRTPILTAEDLAQAIPYCTDVYKWDAQGQGSIGHVKGVGFNNFDIYPGYPYSVNVTSDTIWTVAGSYSDTSFNLITTDGTNINHLAVPLSKNSLTTADELGQDIPNCTDVYYWDAEAQGTIGHVVGLGFENFDVRGGYPYKVNVTATTEWPSTGGGGPMENSGSSLMKSHSLISSKVPHTAYGKLVIPENIKQNDLRLRAWIKDHPQEILTDAKQGIGFDNQYWWVSVSNFATNWQVGDSLVVEILNNENIRLGQSLVTLTDAGSDNGGNIRLAGLSSSSNFASTELPKDFGLSQNYPNPFNPETRIGYRVPKNAHVHIQIYDISGRLVRTLADKTVNAGHHVVTWNGQDNSGQLVSSGLYFCKMNSANFQRTLKLVFAK